MRLLLLLLTVALPLVAEEHWDIVYRYTQLDSVLTLNDFSFPSAKRGMACGYTTDRKGKDHPFLTVTADGGANWTEVPAKDTCLSLFFLDDGNGWMVSSKGLWYTAEAGRSWTRLKAPAGFIKVWFLNRQHGFAAGLDKTVAETFDGGDTWKPISILQDITGDPRFTTFGEIAFLGDRGLISGWNIPPRPGGPDWMETDREMRRQLPNYSVILETLDGGKTWTKSESSIFGQITRINMADDNLGLGLIQFRDAFEYPAEVYGVNLKGGKMQRVYRETDRAITDVKQAPVTHRTFLIGYETSGTIYRSPIPGKLKIIMSDDLTEWKEMEVDYRAVAHTAFLSIPTQDAAYAATDTGMILKLIKD